MKPPSLSRLKPVLKRFRRASILVIGDLILDEFIWGRVSRISPEAPVPVVWVKSENFMPGGACNVAGNIRALGGRVEVMGLVGRDDRSQKLLDLLRRSGVGTDGMFQDPDRPTTLKTRVIAHSQQVVRIDREHTAPLSSGALKFFLKTAGEMVPRVDAICLEDYGKGMITPDLVRPLVRLARRHGKIITVDPKEDHLSYYRGVTAITPNHHEAGELSRIRIRDEESLDRAGEKLLRLLGCENVLITRGESGMVLFQNRKKPVKIPTMAQAVYDVSGAGDTVIAAFTLARALKATAPEAAYLANCAAGVVVGKVGTAFVEADELWNRVRQMRRDA